MATKGYTFHEYTQSICPECMKIVPAKIVFSEKDNKVYLHKRCSVHGEQVELFEDNKGFFLREQLFSKPGTVCAVQTKIAQGCPFDCGLCPDHEQHTCIGLIEITNFCNLKCPLCYARSGQGAFLSLSKIEAMMDFFQETEGGKAEILQISGGEPTTHPEIIKILQLAKAKKFKYVMLNTHGLRCAGDLDFVKELQQFKGGFEVYLQFDGLQPTTYEQLRGRNLIEEKMRAIQNLDEYGIPMTLVTTLAPGLNDKEIGAIIDLGLKTKHIRGINFQPVAYWGRMPAGWRPGGRLTMTGVLEQIEAQTSGMLKVSDFVPLPCHPERVAFTYLYRQKDSFIPVTRHIDTAKYIPMINNTFTFYPEDIIKSIAKGQVSFSPTKGLICSDGNCFNILKDFNKIIPKSYWLKSKIGKFKHIDDNTFRISVTSFIDAYNFDMKSMKKECVHIITPDLKKIPFSSYNMIHRATNA